MPRYEGHRQVRKGLELAPRVGDGIDVEQLLVRRKNGAEPPGHLAHWVKKLPAPCKK